MVLKTVVNALKENDLQDIAIQNPLAVTIGSAAVGGVLAAGTAVAIGARRKAKRRTTKTVRSRRKTTKKLTARQKLVRRIKRRKGRQTPYTAGARRDRSRTRIRYTKNGQPYTLQGKGGRAKFISKATVKRRKAAKRRR